MRPSINKKMCNEGKRTEDGVVWGGHGGEGGEREWEEGSAPSFFSEIGILSFTAELMGPDIELK